MLHGVADLLPTILFVPDPFGRLLCNSVRNAGIWSSSNFCQRAQVNRKAMTAQRARARVRIVENDPANADQRMRDPRKNDEDCDQDWYRQRKPVGCRFSV